MAPILPGSRAYANLETERLRAQKHQLILELEREKAYVHPRGTKLPAISQAQTTLQNMSMERDTSEISSIVKEAQTRGLLESYTEPRENRWGSWIWIVLIVIVIAVVGRLY